MYKLIHRSMRVCTNPYRIPFPLKLKKNISVAIPKNSYLKKEKVILQV